MPTDNFPDSSLPKRFPNYTLQQNNHHAVLVNMVDKREYKISNFDAAVWRLCSGKKTTLEIIQKMSQQFPELANAISHHVRNSLEQMRTTRRVYCPLANKTVVALPRNFENAKLLSRHPIVASIDDFISEQDCKTIISIGEDNLKRASVAKNSERVISDYRTNRLTHLKFSMNPILQQVGEKACGLLNMPIENCEPPQVLHYAIGEEYKIHGDAFDLLTDNGITFTQRGGQRVASMLIYLNEVEAGGETAFPNLGISVTPKPGRAVIFYNCYPDTTVPDVNSYHHALPVIAGEKWSMPFWFREGKF